MQFMSHTYIYREVRVQRSVQRSANIQFMLNKTRKEWVLKTCGSLVARQPWRSALEDLVMSPIILKASIKLVWTCWCHLSVRCVAETDHWKLLILSTCHSVCQ